MPNNYEFHLLLWDESIFFAQSKTHFFNIVHFYYQDGVQELDFKKNMSLSYFLGYGYDMEALALYQKIDLTWKGKLMFLLLLIGFPFLMSYRFALKKRVKDLDK